MKKSYIVYLSLLLSIICLQAESLPISKAVAAAMQRSDLHLKYQRVLGRNAVTTIKGARAQIRLAQGLVEIYQDNWGRNFADDDEDYEESCKYFNEAVSLLQEVFDKHTLSASIRAQAQIELGTVFLIQYHNLDQDDEEEDDFDRGMAELESVAAEFPENTEEGAEARYRMALEYISMCANVPEDAFPHAARLLREIINGFPVNTEIGLRARDRFLEELNLSSPRLAKDHLEMIGLAEEIITEQDASTTMGSRARNVLADIFVERGLLLPDNRSSVDRAIALAREVIAGQPIENEQKVVARYNLARGLLAKRSFREVITFLTPILPIPEQQVWPVELLLAEALLERHQSHHFLLEKNQSSRDLKQAIDLIESCSFVLGGRKSEGSHMVICDNIRYLHAFALFRRNGPGDLDLAISFLQYFLLHFPPLSPAERMLLEEGANTQSLLMSAQARSLLARVLWTRNQEGDLEQALTLSREVIAAYPVNTLQGVQARIDIGQALVLLSENRRSTEWLQYNKIGVEWLQEVRAAYPANTLEGAEARYNIAIDYFYKTLRRDYKAFLSGIVLLREIINWFPVHTEIGLRARSELLEELILETLLNHSSRLVYHAEMIRLAEEIITAQDVDVGYVKRVRNILLDVRQRAPEMTRAVPPPTSIKSETKDADVGTKRNSKKQDKRPVKKQRHSPESSEDVVAAAETPVAADTAATGPDRSSVLEARADLEVQVATVTSAIKEDYAQRGIELPPAFTEGEITRAARRLGWAVSVIQQVAQYYLRRQQSAR